MILKCYMNLFQIIDSGKVNTIFDFGLKLSLFVDCKYRHGALKNGEECYEEIITYFDVVSFCFSC